MKEISSKNVDPFMFARWKNSILILNDWKFYENLLKNNGKTIFAEIAFKNKNCGVE